MTDRPPKPEIRQSGNLNEKAMHTLPASNRRLGKMNLRSPGVILLSSLTLGSVAGGIAAQSIHAEGLLKPGEPAPLPIVGDRSENAGVISARCRLFTPAPIRQSFHGLFESIYGYSKVLGCKDVSTPPNRVAFTTIETCLRRIELKKNGRKIRVIPHEDLVCVPDRAAGVPKRENIYDATALCFPSEDAPIDLPSMPVQVTVRMTFTGTNGVVAYSKKSAGQIGTVNCVEE